MSSHWVYLEIYKLIEEEIWRKDYSQTPTIKTRYQIRETFPFNTHLGRENIIPYGERCRNDRHIRSMQHRGQGRSELSHGYYHLRVK